MGERKTFGAVGIGVARRDHRLLQLIAFQDGPLESGPKQCTVVVLLAEQRWTAGGLRVGRTDVTAGVVSGDTDSMPTSNRSRTAGRRRRWRTFLPLARFRRRGRTILSDTGLRRFRKFRPLAIASE